MREQGETYFWNEFQLVAPDGDVGYLEYEEGKWKWMKPFIPRTPLGPIELVNQTPGTSLKLEETAVPVTQNSTAQTYLAEGPLTFNAETGDRVNYLDAGSSKQLYSVQWSANEIEFFRGHQVSAREVFSAFGLTEELRAVERVQLGRRSANIFTLVCLVCALISSMLWFGSGPRSGKLIAWGTYPISSIGTEGVRLGPFNLNPADKVHCLTVHGTMTQSSAWIQGVVETAQGDELLEAQGDFWDESGYDDSHWHEWYLASHSYFMARTTGPYYIRLYAERENAAGSYGDAGYQLSSGATYPNYLGWYAALAISLATLFFIIANGEKMKEIGDSMD
jgi:hypothetical protein